MGSMMNEKPTFQELINLVQFLSQRLQKLDQFEPLCLNVAEKSAIDFCVKNRNYSETE
jgi:hypothetical protein